MLIDATHPEETRVVVADGNKVEEFDFESLNKRQLAGNIYLAKVTRVEPSLQAAFVDYGGNRHGFLAFPEIHPDYYQIPKADREALLAEERAYAEAAAAQAERDEAAREAEQAEDEARDADAAEDEDAVEAAPKKKSRSRTRRKKKTDAAEVPAAEEAAHHGADAAPEDAPAEDGAAEDAAPEGDASDEVEVPDGDAPSKTMAEGAGLEDKTLSEDDPEAAPEVADAAPADPEAETASDAPPPGADAGEAPKKRSRSRTRSRAKAPDPEADAAAGSEAATAPAGMDVVEPEGGDAAADGPVEDLVEDRRGDDVEAKPKRSRSRRGRGKKDAADKDSSVETVADDDSTDDVRLPPKPRARKYKIQEVVKVRQIMLVQVVKEERGNKGAALTTYLSLAGRYCVLMPNTARGGGISRKITNAPDRKKLKEIASEIDVPQGAGLIIRTAGAKRTKTEIKRDYEYLQRQWEQIRELTLKSIAPAPIYEEGNLIHRSIRDLYNRDIDEVVVEGEEGYRQAKDYMKLIMPSHAKNVKHYADPMPLFARHQVQNYLDSMFNPTVQLKSGGYIVIGITEALVAVDVNSGKATKEGSIEETATKTNLEAAEEVARQCRLRDLAGLIVIDFIDMDERKNNNAVEKRLKDALKNDRARIQVGRISGFGLLEMSRQRLRPGMLEATTQPCSHCHGTGLIRSDDSIALQVLRALEEEGTRKRSREVLLKLPVQVANYLMNEKREHLATIEGRYGMAVRIEADPDLTAPNFHLEKFKTATRQVPKALTQVIQLDTSWESEDEVEEAEIVETDAGEDEGDAEATTSSERDEDGGDRPKKKRRRRSRRRKNGGSDEARDDDGQTDADGAAAADAADGDDATDRSSDAATAVEAEPATDEPATDEATTEVEPAPKRSSRTRRRSKATPAEDAPVADAPTEPAEEAEPASTPSDDPDPEARAAEPEPAADAKPKRPRKRARAAAPAPSDEAPAEGVSAELAEVAEIVPDATETTDTTDTTGAAPAADAKPKKRGWWSHGG